MMMACLLTAGMAFADEHWVGTWATAPQLVERHNNLTHNSLTHNNQHMLKANNLKVNQ